MKKINQKVNRLQWDHAAYECNLSYETDINDITVSAAFLQPIYFFTPKVDDMAFNFGAVGAAIGHAVIF